MKTVFGSSEWSLSFITLGEGEGWKKMSFTVGFAFKYDGKHGGFLCCKTC